MQVNNSVKFSDGDNSNMMGLFRDELRIRRSSGVFSLGFSVVKVDYGAGPKGGVYFFRDWIRCGIQASKSCLRLDQI